MQVDMVVVMIVVMLAIEGYGCEDGGDDYKLG